MYGRKVHPTRKKGIRERTAPFVEQQPQGFREQLLHGGFLLRSQQPQALAELRIEGTTDVRALGLASSGGGR